MANIPSLGQAAVGQRTAFTPEGVYQDIPSQSIIQRTAFTPEGVHHTPPGQRIIQPVALGISSNFNAPKVSGEQEWSDFLQKLTQGVRDCFPTSMETVLQQASDACGPHLKCINTGVTALDSFNLPKLTKEFHRLDPYVKNGKSLAYLHMRRGLNFAELLKRARDNGIIVKFDGDVNELLKKVGDISVEKDYAVLMPYGVFKNSQSMLHANQKEFVKQLGCRMPTFLECFALFVCAGEGEVFEMKPEVSMLSSTCIKKQPLAVGCSLVVNEKGFISKEILITISDDDCSKQIGAGGCLEI